MKKLSALMLGFASVFFLSGCSAQDRSGTFYETFVKPMDMFLSKIHEYVGSWGWSIVIITLIVRIIILPFMLNNYKTQNKARRGQVLARPELEVVQAKQKAAREKEARAISNEEKTQARAELMELQREQMAIMKKYDANPISVGGCLPLLIQMPFLTGLFFTLTNPPTISTTRSRSNARTNANDAMVKSCDDCYLLILGGWCCSRLLYSWGSILNIPNILRI